MKLDQTVVRCITAVVIAAMLCGTHCILEWGKPTLAVEQVNK